MTLLEIYLNDHWAGAGAGLALVRRMSANNAGTEWGERLAWLADQIEEDDHTLADVRRALGIEGGDVKRALALVSERVSRLKLNGRLLGYSPLSRLVEAEAMLAGVAAKQRLWDTLQQGPAQSPELSGFDFDRLVDRAGQQLELLHDFHLDAASRALG